METPEKTPTKDKSEKEKEADAAIDALNSAIKEAQDKKELINVLSTKAKGIGQLPKLEADHRQLVETSYKPTVSADIRERFFKPRIDEKSKALQELDETISEIIRVCDSLVVEISKCFEKAEVLYAELAKNPAAHLKAKWDAAQKQAKTEVKTLLDDSVDYRMQREEVEVDRVFALDLKKLLSDLSERKNLDQCLKNYEKIAQVVFARTARGYELNIRANISEELKEKSRGDMELLVGEIYKIRKRQLNGLLKKVDTQGSSALMDSIAGHLDDLARYLRQRAAVSKTPQKYIDESKVYDNDSIRYQLYALHAKATEASKITQDADEKNKSNGIAEGLSSTTSAITACFDDYDDHNHPRLAVEQCLVIHETLSNICSDISIQCHLLKNETSLPAARALFDDMMHDAATLVARLKRGIQSLGIVEKPNPQAYAEILDQHGLTDIANERVLLEPDFGDDHSEAETSTPTIEEAPSRDEKSVAAASSNISKEPIEETGDAQGDIAKKNVSVPKKSTFTTDSNVLPRSAGTRVSSKAVPSKSNVSSATAASATVPEKFITQLKKEHDKLEKRLRKALEKATPLRESSNAHRLETPVGVANIGIIAAQRYEALAAKCEELRVRYTQQMSRQKKDKDSNSLQAAQYGQQQRAYEKEAKLYRKNSKVWQLKRSLAILGKDIDDTVFAQVSNSVFTNIDVKELSQRFVKLDKNGQQRVDKETGEYIRDHVVRVTATLPNGHRVYHHTHLELATNERIPAETLLTQHRDKFVAAGFKRKGQEDLTRAEAETKGIALYHGKSSFEATDRFLQIRDELHQKQRRSQSANVGKPGMPGRK